MAMQSQGVRIRRASTATVFVSTSLDVGTSFINWPDAAADFAAAGFTTSMVINSTDNTACRAVKSVAATQVVIWGTFGTTGSTDRRVNGWPMETVGEVTDFSGPGGQAADVDITALLSTAKEFLQGLRDEGELTLSLNFNATDAGQAGMINDRAARLRNYYDILFTDYTWSATSFPSRASFWGYCKGFSISGAVDDKVSAQAVIRIDGPVLFSTHDS